MTTNNYASQIAQIKAKLQKQLDKKEQQEIAAIATYFTNWDRYTK